jgi:AcrR family transcriptional regulator
MARVSRHRRRMPLWVYMRKAAFQRPDFLAAARSLVNEQGPATVTVESVMLRLNAPKGSFYYRFDSRDALLGELWLTTILEFQEGFFAALDSGDGLGAALHMPAWSRSHLDDARMLLLYNRHDFVHGEWPESLKQGVKNQANRLMAGFSRFAQDAFGQSTSTELQYAAFVLVEAPGAAVKEHIRRREPPPALVDDLIRKTYHAIVPKRATTGTCQGARKKH